MTEYDAFGITLAEPEVRPTVRNAVHTLRTNEAIVCPECGVGLFVRRMNTKTNRAFLGCSRFPACPASASIEQL